jgi:hypothetical protein
MSPSGFKMNGGFFACCGAMPKCLRKDSFMLLKRYMSEKIDIRKLASPLKHRVSQLANICNSRRVHMSLQYTSTLINDLRCIYVPLFLRLFASQPIGALAFLCLRYRSATLSHPRPSLTYKPQAGTPISSQSNLNYLFPISSSSIKIPPLLQFPSYPSPTIQYESRRSQPSVLRVHLPSLFPSFRITPT